MLFWIFCYSQPKLLLWIAESKTEEKGQVGDSRGSEKTWWWIQVGEGRGNGEKWMD